MAEKKKYFDKTYGLEKIQRDDINEELSMAIWNWMFLYFFKVLKNESKQLSEFQEFFHVIWAESLNKDIYDIPTAPKSMVLNIRHLYNRLDWKRKYRLIEYVLEYYPFYDVSIIYNGVVNLHKQSVIALNEILSHHNSAFRFVDSRITEITSKIELEAIKEAIDNGVFPGTETHLKKSIKHLSDLENPDYGNSVKESILAVESACRHITGKNDLGKALALLKKRNVHINHNLEEAFKKLYHYRGDEAGVAHSLLSDTEKIKKEDAKFMLITCSAFINYLKVKKDSPS